MSCVPPESTVAAGAKLQDVCKQTGGRGKARMRRTAGFQQYGFGLKEPRDGGTDLVDSWRGITCPASCDWIRVWVQLESVCRSLCGCRSHTRRSSQSWQVWRSLRARLISSFCYGGSGRNHCGSTGGSQQAQHQPWAYVDMHRDVRSCFYPKAHRQR